ncbi:allatotropin-like peptide precursor [Aplysia californica]|nr:allatotropin-like peptide precursor [Aplysia californica]ADU04497.1 allatotropin-like peptide precursor protein [Aplysia californica]ADX20599.1 allatotropin-2 [Aplysia californica]
MLSAPSIAHTGVALLVLMCLCPFSQSTEASLSRAKRGFRLNSASRVAHGYGKRGYASSSGAVPYPELARDVLDNLRAEEEEKELEWSIMSVDELASLLQSHPKLARALVKKFVDINGDNLVTAEELFRPPTRK